MDLYESDPIFMDFWISGTHSNVTELEEAKKFQETQVTGVFLSKSSKRIHFTKEHKNCSFFNRVQFGMSIPHDVFRNNDWALAYFWRWASFRIEISFLTFLTISIKFHCEVSANCSYIFFVFFTLLVYSNGLFCHRGLIKADFEVGTES